jgi:hypothetical protein
MLTDKEMLNIAERYLKRKGEFGGSEIEVVILKEEIIKKSYGNIYYYQSKEFILTGNINKALTPGTPFLVEKSTGRVVAFASAMSLENNIKSYENGKMTPSLDLYWYPDENRFDYK